MAHELQGVPHLASEGQASEELVDLEGGVCARVVIQAYGGSTGQRRSHTHTLHQLSSGADTRDRPGHDYQVSDVLLLINVTHCQGRGERGLVFISHSHTLSTLKYRWNLIRVARVSGFSAFSYKAQRLM